MPEQTQEKYYPFSVAFNDFEGNEIELAFHFKKPGKSAYNRTLKEIAKHPDKAFNNLLITLIKPEEKEALTSAMNEHVGIASSFANAIIEQTGAGAATLGKSLPFSARK